jgi:hypothetical protein
VEGVIEAHAEAVVEGVIEAHAEAVVEGVIEARAEARIEVQEKVRVSHDVCLCKSVTSSWKWKLRWERPS